MKNEYSLKDLHIGKIIREIASQKQISSEKIAASIHRYQHNADKIYKLEDMDIEDVIKISHLLEYNFLKIFSDKYLSYLPFIENRVDKESFFIELDFKKNHFTVKETINNFDFLKRIHIGQQIKNIAKKKGWSEKYLANKLECSQSRVSNLYKSKSLKVKKIIQLSDTLKHHLIAEIYLPFLFVPFSINMLKDCIIYINEQQVQVKNTKNEMFSMLFQRKAEHK